MCPSWVNGSWWGNTIIAILFPTFWSPLQLGQSSGLSDKWAVQRSLLGGSSGKALFSGGLMAAAAFFCFPLDFKFSHLLIISSDESWTKSWPATEQLCHEDNDLTSKTLVLLHFPYSSFLDVDPGLWLVSYSFLPEELPEFWMYFEGRANEVSRRIGYSLCLQASPHFRLSFPVKYSPPVPILRPYQKPLWGNGLLPTAFMLFLHPGVSLLPHHTPTLYEILNYFFWSNSNSFSEVSEDICKQTEPPRRNSCQE